MPAQTGTGFEGIFMIVIMFAILYFVMIRPQKKKEKEQKRMIAALKPGDEIETIGGIRGKIMRVKDELFLIESGMGTNKSFLTIERTCVSRFLKQAEENKQPTPIPQAPEAEALEVKED